jgi:hypothetical protein
MTASRGMVMPMHITTDAAWFFRRVVWSTTSSTCSVFVSLSTFTHEVRKASDLGDLKSRRLLSGQSVSIATCHKVAPET